MTDRIRKAWRVRVFDHANPAPDASPWFTEVLHASTGSRARAAMVNRLQCSWDVSWRDALTMVKVQRAPDADVRLPPQHWLVDCLNARERAILLHTFGANQGWKEAGNRNHFCGDPGDLTLLRLAWVFGLLSGPHGEKAYGETGMWIGAFFYLTELGKTVVTSMAPTYPGECHD